MAEELMAAIFSYWGRDRPGVSGGFEEPQQALADAVGCTRRTIILLEQSRYVPSLALALRIARTFGTTVEDVFQLAGDEPLGS